MSVAAAITTFNRLDSLERCVECVRAQTAPVAAIIVVNDVSTDGTREWLDQQPDVIAIHQPENGGCANSFHTVMRAAFDGGHDFVWAMDDDVYPEPDALTVLLESCAELQAAGNRVGGLAPYQLHWDEGGTTWLPYRLPTSLSHALRHSYHSPEVPIERGRGAPQPVDYYAFNGTLLTRDALAEAGFPDVEYYYYGEDTEYGLRLCELGFANYVVPKALVEHPGAGFKAPELLPVKANWRYYYMYRNKLAHVRLVRPRLGFMKALACRVRIVAGACKRLVMESARGNFGACRLTLMGLADGVTGRMGKRITPGATG